MGIRVPTEDATQAAMLHGGAARLRHTTGYVLPAPRARELEREQTDIRASLGLAAYEAAWAEGESMKESELVEHANKTLAPESPRTRT